MTTPDGRGFMKDLALLLADADRCGKSIPIDDLIGGGPVPTSVEDGFAAQEEVVKASGKTIEGWKIAVNGKGRPIAAAILDIYAANTDGISHVAKPGATAIEIEICYRLSRDIPLSVSSALQNRKSLVKNVAAVHLGVEILSRRVSPVTTVPFPLFLADRLGNHSFVLGPMVEGLGERTRADQILDARALCITVDGHVVFEGEPRHPLEDPLLPFLKYCDRPQAAWVELKAGHVVTTGSLCGVIDVPPGGDVEVWLDKRPVLRVIFPREDDG